ncbi:glycine cleavage T C-terminal barrel domain-containing protein [Virgibacillus soli]|uniref:glycine cleavage T C-terminal barrel domain-containing protein n=1 Tax=Paracerasibacillus soli TaxID=480284 RepID=UPI0035E880E6
MNLNRVLQKQLGNIGDKSVVDELGDYQIVQRYVDVEKEYDALRNHVGIIDYTANGKIKITGDDPVEFLNEFLTIDIEFMDIEKVDFSLILDEDAQVIDLVTIYHQEDYILIETSAHQREKIHQLLLHGNNDDIVVVEDVTNQFAIIGFEGPYAWKVGREFLDFDISSLPFQSFVETTWQDQSILFARTGVTGEYGYKICVAASSGLKLWEHLLEQDSEDFSVHPVGMQALEIAMLEVRQPNVRYETSELNVFEACLEWLVHFDKDEFAASEVLQEIREEGVDKRLVGFCFDAKEVLAKDDTILVEHVEVGKVVQVVHSYQLGKKLALGVVEDIFAVSGLSLVAYHHEKGQLVPIETISSPYVIPKSWEIKIV